MMNELEKMRLRLLDDGIAAVGFSDVSNAVPERFKQYPFAVSLLVRLSDAILNEVTDSPTYSYFHHYRTVNAFLDQKALFVTEYLRRLGSIAFPVAASQSVHDTNDKYSGVFQHKTAAHLAGLGWIGKSALFISNEHGPRVRLATVLTDLPLPVNENQISASRCGDCKLCGEACPAHAIRGINYELGMTRADIFDAQACSEHMKRRYQHIGRGSVCGICISVCPFGKKHNRA